MMLGVAQFSSVLAADTTLEGKTIRLGLTPAFLHDQYQLLTDWQHYLRMKIGQPVEFVPRDSYRETIDLLRLEKVGAA